MVTIFNMILNLITAFVISAMLFDMAVLAYRLWPDKINNHLTQFLDCMDRLVADKKNGGLIIDIVLLLYIAVSICILR